MGLDLVKVAVQAVSAVAGHFESGIAIEGVASAPGIFGRPVSSFQPGMAFKPLVRSP